MNISDYLEKKFRRFAIPNITLYLITGQVILFVLNLSGQIDLSFVRLIPELVREGQWWRLISFIFIPPAAHPVLIVFAWYLFYLMGSALEGHWGTFRFNLFLLIGYITNRASHGGWPAARSGVTRRLRLVQAAATRSVCGR